ncbi:MAG: D-hexose-6-phosphate mutarotase [Pseudomonadota bacterium]
MVTATGYAAGPGGLPMRRLAAAGAHAELCAHGAHVTAWRPAGETQSRLYLSARSAFRSGVAIRGGVPVIFPQFAVEGPLPRHGFARTARWRPDPAQNDRGRAVLQLDETLATDVRWPHAYRAELCVELAARSLALQLSVANTGAQPFAFTAALHSYCAVDDVRAASVHGLCGLRYRDSAGGMRVVVDTTDAVRFAGEVDRIYFDVPGTVELREPRRQLQVRASGFPDCVIWNPGAEKAAALADLDADGHLRFVCIEAAVIGRPVRLEPGASWSGTQTLRAA